MVDEMTQRGCPSSHCYYHNVWNIVKCVHTYLNTKCHATLKNHVTAQGFGYPPPTQSSQVPRKQLPLPHIITHDMTVFLSYLWILYKNIMHGCISLGGRIRIPCAPLPHSIFPNWITLLALYLLVKQTMMTGDFTWLGSTINVPWRQLKNSMVSVRKQTIPTERPPLVSEVSANFLRIEGATWSAWRIPTAVFSAF
jgi:hypothetical protein